MANEWKVKYISRQLLREKTNFLIAEEKGDFNLYALPYLHYQIQNHCGIESENLRSKGYAMFIGLEELHVVSVSTRELESPLWIAKPFEEPLKEYLLANWWASINTVIFERE